VNLLLSSCSSMFQQDALEADRTSLRRGSLRRAVAMATLIDRTVWLRRTDPIHYLHVLYGPYMCSKPAHHHSLR